MQPRGAVRMGRPFCLAEEFILGIYLSNGTGG